MNDETKGVDVDLEVMFRAGKYMIPDKGDEIAGYAVELRHYLQALDVQAALAGDPAMLRNLLKVGDAIYDGLRAGVTSMNNAAAAMLATAKDFVETDAQAREDLRTMDATLHGINLKDLPTPPPSEVPDDLDDPSQPGAGRPDDEPMTGHPSQGGTPSTPDPVSPEQDAEDRDDQQQQSEQEHPYVPEVG
jgi:hypothetical protein